MNDTTYFNLRDRYCDKLDYLRRQPYTADNAFLIDDILDSLRQLLRERNNYSITF